VPNTKRARFAAILIMAMFATAAAVDHAAVWGEAAYDAPSTSRKIHVHVRLAARVLTEWHKPTTWGIADAGRSIMLKGIDQFRFERVSEDASRKCSCRNSARR